MAGPEDQPAAAQRRWRAACPNCGAPVEFASSASASAVCSFCRSTLLREGEALRRIGKSAELFDDHSPLQLGATGRYAGAGFTLIGRLQLAYAEGTWNEWHLLFDGGERSGWLAEDNGSYVISLAAPLPQRPPQAHELVLGAELLLDGQRWRVAALTPARVNAAQGELPRPPAGARQEFLVAELRNSANEVGSLEYLAGADQPPSWSIGRPVRLAELAMSGLRSDAEGAAISSAAIKAQAHECPSCGAALQPRLDNSLSIVCGQCQAVVDISQGLGKDLQHYRQQGHALPPLIPLGRSGSLALQAGGPALPWQVVGYLERCDVPAPDSEDEQTFWREYLLYNRQEGFAFLVDSEDGWSLVRPLTGAPSGRGAQVVWQGKTFRRRYDEAYTATTTYVLGEFYWRVRRDERVEVSDYEAPGSAGGSELLSSERSGQEISWSHGRSVDASEIQRAFKLAEAAPLLRDSKPTSGAGLFVKVLVFLFIVFVLITVMRGCASDDCADYKKSYGENSNEYQECKRRMSSGSGVRIGNSGGSYGGWRSGGGGHK